VSPFRPVPARREGPRYGSSTAPRWRSSSRTRSPPTRPPASGSPVRGCGCSRRSSPPRSCASARTTATTPPRWVARSPSEPLFFLKPSSSVIGPGEADPAAGRPLGRGPPRGRARRRDRCAAAAGHARAGHGRGPRLHAANDVTARDLQRREAAVVPRQGVRLLLPPRARDRHRPRPLRPAHPLHRRRRAAPGRHHGRPGVGRRRAAERDLPGHHAAAERRGPDGHPGRRRAAAAGPAVRVEIEGIGVLENPVVDRDAPAERPNGHG
jgi:hypothetical protein